MNEVSIGAWSTLLPLHFSVAPLRVSVVPGVPSECCRTVAVAVLAGAQHGGTEVHGAPGAEEERENSVPVPAFPFSL